MVFRSKIDLWLLAVFALASMPPLVAAVAALRSGANWTPHAVIFVLVAAPLVWFFASTRYTVSEDAILVQCGPFRWRINAKDISKVVPSRSMISSPALSLDRLRIEYGPGKSLLVSPEDKEGFVKAITAAKGAA